MSYNLPNILSEREIYTVTTESKIFSFIMLLLVIWFIVLGVIFPDPPENFVERTLLRLLIFAFAFMIFMFVPRYKISFRESCVVISVGYYPFFRVRLDRNKITHVGLVQWNPLKDFGGSGIKHGFGKYKNYWCFNVLGGKGIEIKTTEKNYAIEVSELERHRLLSMIGDYARGKEIQKTKSI